MCGSQYVYLKGVSVKKSIFFVGNRVEFNEKVEVNYIDDIDVSLKNRKNMTLKRNCVKFDEKVEVNYIDDIDMLLKTRWKMTLKRKVLRKINRLRSTFN